ncbi:MAG: DUF4912 domain-containing protein, partial [Planctomycetes bacterium]|nr:DUF4912 domain-containing protein [Planctomycetota bacterium]
MKATPVQSRNRIRYPLPGPSRRRLGDASEELCKYFRDNYPILLDGALPGEATPNRLVRQAKDTLARNGVRHGELPAAILRETLSSIKADFNPATKVGMTAVGPRRVRVWWDNALLGNLDDVLTSLDRPRLVLRFYDITGIGPDSARWNNLFDIDIELVEQGKTVDFWSPDRQYVVELGLVHADGQFLALAKTNPAEIPRECKGNKNPGQTARSKLQPRARVDSIAADSAVAIDAGETDSPSRDVEAEMLIRTLYRIFLDEGPRVLRRAPKLMRKDAAVLRREFNQRCNSRDRAKRNDAHTKPGLFIARLDSRKIDFPELEPCFLPALLAPASRVDAFLIPDQFALYDNWLALSQSGVHESAGLSAGEIVSAPLPGLVAARTEAEPIVSIVRTDLHPHHAAAASTSVFTAARTLMEKLEQLDQLPESASSKLEQLRRSVKRETANLVNPSRDNAGEADAVRELKRAARAGVRFTRLALLLEGMADKDVTLSVGNNKTAVRPDGKFHLEYDLLGKKMRIPVSICSRASIEYLSNLKIAW